MYCITTSFRDYLEIIYFSVMIIGSLSILVIFLSYYLSKKHFNHSSKYTGVSWNKSANRWHAQIRYKKQRIHIGFFKNELDAGLAYQRELGLILTNKNYTNERKTWTKTHVSI